MNNPDTSVSISAPAQTPELSTWLAILAELPLGVLLLDDEGRVRYANAALTSRLQSTLPELQGQPAERLKLPPAQKTALLAEGQVRFYAHEGAELLRCLTSPAAPDWLAFLEYEVSRSRRYGSELALMLLRLEGPESCPAELEQNVAFHLRDHLRWADLIGRDGAGEFVVILPQTAEGALPVLAMKLSNCLPALPEGWRISLGHSLWQRGDDALRLLKRARENATPLALVG